jgi:glycerophosphoryl diester phosphodiesterase
MSHFDLQGHRGARGLKPENTLPSFEAALDAGVTSIETDVHLSRDGVPILIHDHVLGPPIYRLAGDTRSPLAPTRVADLTLTQLRRFQADGNPDPFCFPEQHAEPSPLAQDFAQEQGIGPYAPPTLGDLLAFAAAYAGSPGARVGKTPSQRETARRVRFDLELKRVPFHPDAMNDHFDGETPGRLEFSVVSILRKAGVVDRTVVRSSDHRAVRCIRHLEPGLTGAVLVADTAPVEPGLLARAADALVYCPKFTFLDRKLVRDAHAEGIRVLPWTVNEPEAWRRLLDWEVDGITTDYPDRLAVWLRDAGICSKT